MKITFVLPFAGWAGGIRVLAIYAQKLSQRGHDVFIISESPKRHSLRKQIRNIIRHGKFRQKQKTGHFDELGLPHTVLPPGRHVTDADLPDADVVLATWWRTADPVARLAPEKGAKVYFVQEYGAPGQSLEDVAPTWRLPLHLITISRSIQDLVMQEVGQTCDLVPNAVDFDLFDAPARYKQPSLRVGFAYRLGDTKGLDIIVDALNQARSQRPELRAVAFGGSGGKRVVLPDFVEYRGRVDERELPRIYGSCDAWLFGSRREGFGLPILEAMACRTPVIATPAGAAPELLAGGGGILLADFDPKEMARAILRIGDMYDGAWRSMSDSAHRTAHGYTWDDATDRFEAGLLLAIERSRRSEIAGGSLSQLRNCA